jgi:hypothetical protein
MAKDSNDYFSKMEMGCPMYKNVADHYMNILSVNYPKNEKDEEKVNRL